ncbi:MAG: lysoplasmalogenase [Clostridia bacterium]|nr:lysoplasmalogenase [Clostridia bacterium]
MEKSIALFLGILILMVLTGSLSFLLRDGRYYDHKKRLLLKTLCSIMFWLFGWITLWYTGIGIVPFTLFMVFGFTLSVAGDVFLVYDSRHCFVFGLLSFFLAHVSYCVSFIMRYGFDVRNLVIFAVISAIAIIIINFTGIFVLGEMRIPANLYLLILSFMLGNALVGLDYWKEIGLPVVFTAVGAALFFLSDFTLAYERFSRRGRQRLERPVLVTYYAAQILLALGILLI